MSDLFAARSQMALSLAFHIVFAIVGMAMPLLMSIAEWRWLRTRDPVYRELAKRWAKGTAILFAVGAVSGTVLSFELGLLWPRFMDVAGPVFGMPFALEGFAFFLEAIFLGIYLYGWDRVPERVHLGAGILVFICGTLSGVFVVTANAWMNTPAGFELSPAGEVISVEPWKAMFNPAAFQQCLHMVLAAFAAVGFLVAGIHAIGLLRRPGSRFHRPAFAIGLAVGGIASVLQPISGDISAKNVAKYQPAKLAAMESLWTTQTHAPLLIGGWPDEDARETRFGIELPGMLSFLAFGDFSAEVAGLEDIPDEQWPPVATVHFAFQVMVGCGMLMALTALIGAVLAWRRRSVPEERWFLKLCAVCTPLGVIAIEAGWVVTEVGRQPWAIYEVMTVAESVTPMPGLVVPFATFTILYLGLAAIVAVLLKRELFDRDVDAEIAGAPDTAALARERGAD